MPDPTWGCVGFAMMFTIRAFDVPMTFFQSFLLMGLGALGVAVPVPAGLGAVGTPRTGRGVETMETTMTKKIRQPKAPATTIAPTAKAP